MVDRLTYLISFILYWLKQWNDLRDVMCLYQPNRAIISTPKTIHVKGGYSIYKAIRSIPHTIHVKGGYYIHSNK